MKLAIDSFQYPEHEQFEKSWGNRVVGWATIAAVIAPTLSTIGQSPTSQPNSSPHQPTTGEEQMDFITVKNGTKIYYKDWGIGQPIVFHHGWPLSADDWDSQMMFFLAQGYRVIAHDRRGHGRSTQTFNGNDMDTYAADVDELVTALE